MVQILDTTLREGEQTPYVNFTVDEKVHIAQMLDRIGVEEKYLLEELEKRPTVEVVRIKDDGHFFEDIPALMVDYVLEQARERV